MYVVGCTPWVGMMALRKHQIVWKARHKLTPSHRIEQHATRELMALLRAVVPQCVVQIALRRASAWSSCVEVVPASVWHVKV
jgi:hypothetical protein